MKALFFAVSLLLVPTISSAQNSVPSDPVEELRSVKTYINSSVIGALPMRDRGRLKPFDTFSRETILFLTGKYTLFKLDATVLYLGLIVAPSADKLEIINIRNTRVRELLGFSKGRRLFSFAEIKKSSLQDLVSPLLQKEEKNSRLLEPEEKDIIEVYNQYWLFQTVRSASHLLNALMYVPVEHDSDTPHTKADTELVETAKIYLQAISGADASEARALEQKLIVDSKKSKIPELFEGQVDKMGLEVFYNKAQVFFIAALLLALMGMLLILDTKKKWIVRAPYQYILILPFVVLCLGFALRVYITGFAPVTNMYGTMIWVSLGISLFSMVLLFLYKNSFVVGCLWLTSAGFLVLTDSIPLILSPDLDPIVAVLRSNLWLTIHVLTIVISYAAFSIAMVLGNIVVGRAMINGHTNDEFVKDVSQSIYRMMQLGVFLLSVGIILGGIWADYSWGRFWGWDPKETWALIADIGFLVILHARFIGWLSPFGVAVSAPLAYLLVVMAWYGVNFILAAGLHSYGFSSGGTAIVITFVLVQLLFIGSYWIAKFLRDQKKN